ncbi:MAG: L-fucose:H+ symporter permease [Bacteroidota bacterium]|jgi:FHS family L-fucose permease-like MFS transporter
MQNSKSYQVPFLLITCLFFLWGFAHNLDPILIPHLKKSFTLTTTQSTLVDSAVFIAYFFMALPAGYIMKRWGYKMGIIAGLLLFSFGAFLFVPAANFQSYPYFLIALFIIACGLTILETAANPYVAALGDPATSTQRLNLAQSFNGLAVALAPAIGARVILTKGHSDQELTMMTAEAKKIALATEAYSVKTPYTILALVLLVIATVFYFIKLPDIRKKESNYPNDQNQSIITGNILNTFKHTHLTWAVIAQFFYVGAQVCVFSLFILYATKSANMSELKAADYLGIGGLAFLIGRFVGTAFMKLVAPNKLLMIYAFASVVLCGIAIIGSGMITIYALIGVCFFMSIMFPTIFSLGIQNLGEDTEMASSLIVMSIVGGAIMPRFFAMIGDASGNIQLGYTIPLLCFIVVGYFGWKGYKVK